MTFLIKSVSAIHTSIHKKLLWVLWFEQSLMSI